MTEAQKPRRVVPLYRPDVDGLIRLYGGPLVVDRDGTETIEVGDVTLRLWPSVELRARILTNASDRISGFVSDGDLRVTGVPEGADLQPPQASALPETGPAEFWVDYRLSLSVLTVGDLRQCARFLIHVGGSMEASLPWEEIDGGDQPRLAFDVLGWSLALAYARGKSDEDFGFSHVIEATPPSTPVDAADLERLLDWLFHLLSFVASREVGVGTVAGLAGDDRVVYAVWAPARQRSGRASVHWCPARDVPVALPQLGQGLTAIAEDETLSPIVRRAIDFLLSADGNEVLDVRVPTACSGLELVAWAVLQRENWISSDVLKKMNAGASVRVLLRSLDIPVHLPAGFSALSRRKRDLGQPDWAGPETLFNVRNNLVHPPRRIDRIEWPSADELFEAWQLSGWYLELCILRLLGYQGTYWSRLRLGRYNGDVEPVPWTVGSGDHAAI